MFSNFAIALIIGAGIGVWIYPKVLRTSGQNTKHSLIVSAVTSALLITLILIVLDILFKKTK